MADNDPNELVEMYHPGLHTGDDPPVSMTTRAAFDDVWKPKGYALTSDGSAATAPPAGPTSFVPPSTAAFSAEGK